MLYNSICTMSFATEVLSAVACCPLYEALGHRKLQSQKQLLHGPSLQLPQRVIRSIGIADPDTWDSQF